MHLISAYFRDLFRTTAVNWNRFWFMPADPATLGLLRILAGAMILYTHAVWSLELSAFFGPHGWLNRDVVTLMQRGGWQWSHLWWCSSPALLWSTHLIGLIVCLMFTLGLWTRVTSILTCVFTLSYAHRSPDALYGLDQINGFLSLYLAIGPCGAAYSLDRWLQSRRSPTALAPAQPTILANISTRLIQWQLCVLGGAGQLGISVGRYALAGSLSLAGQHSDARDNRLGNRIHRSDLGPVISPHRAGAGHPDAFRNRNLPGHDDFWHSDADRQCRICFAEVGEADARLQAKSYHSARQQSCPYWPQPTLSCPGKAIDSALI
jgi:uncharacterized membrane protein YphA (DoxX/SURF4 family)